MKKIYALWLLIWAFAVYATIFARNNILTSIASILVGCFAIATRREVVDDQMEAYKKRSKKFPTLFPPSAINERSYKAGRIMAIILGIAFIIGGAAIYFQSRP